MPMYFDKSGNAYQIDDEKVVTRKAKITLTNESGEEFEIDAAKADEHRLTLEEHQRSFDELNKKVVALGKLLGWCPIIDPIDPYTIREPPRRALPEIQIRDLEAILKIFEGCTNIDPQRLVTILGSLAQRESVTARLGGNRPVALDLEHRVKQMVRELIDGCPAIDPVRLRTLIGTIYEREILATR